MKIRQNILLTEVKTNRQFLVQFFKQKRNNWRTTNTQESLQLGEKMKLLLFHSSRICSFDVTWGLPGLFCPNYWEQSWRTSVCIKSTNFDVMLNIPDSNLSCQNWLRITGCTSKYSEYKQCNIKVCILMLFSRPKKTTVRSVDQLVTTGFCDKLQKPSLCFSLSWIGTAITPFQTLPGNRNIVQAGYRKGLGHWDTGTEMSKI